MFTVENKSGHDLYYVQLSIKAFGQSSDRDDYEYDIAAGSRKPVFPGSDFADTISLGCKTETPGVGVLVFQILRLQPGERREFILTHKANVKSIVKSSVSGFTDQQPPMIGDLHTMEQHFKYPENVVCEHTAWPADGSSKQKVTSTVTPDEDKKK